MVHGSSGCHCNRCNEVSSVTLTGHVTWGEPVRSSTKCVRTRMCVRQSMCVSAFHLTEATYPTSVNFSPPLLNRIIAYFQHIFYIPRRRLNLTGGLTELSWRVNVQSLSQRANSSLLSQSVPLYCVRQRLWVPYRGTGTGELDY